MGQSLAALSVMKNKILYPHKVTGNTFRGNLENTLTAKTSEYFRVCGILQCHATGSTTLYGTSSLVFVAFIPKSWCFILLQKLYCYCS